MKANKIALLHERAEKEYKRWQDECEKHESAYTRVCYDNIYLAIKNGECDVHASILVKEDHPINFLYEELMCHAEDTIYSGIVDFINFRLEELEAKKRDHE